MSSLTTISAARPFEKSLDSSWQIKAAKGWFDSAYRLSTPPGSPFKRDLEIERVMKGFEDRAANDFSLGETLSGGRQARLRREFDS